MSRVDKEAVTTFAEDMRFQWPKTLSEVGKISPSR